MLHSGRQSINISNVLSVIMGGGQGTRLFPLTKERAKPAVPLAGKYRLVDIPISNCINSGFRRIYVLTQFNSASLHRHISQTYKFDHFSGGFVEILAAQQTFTDTSWYQGTADAVRKNLIHFLNHDFDYLLILSGDQLYRMDFRRVIDQHAETGADITVATIPVDRHETRSRSASCKSTTTGASRGSWKSPRTRRCWTRCGCRREWYPQLGIEGEGELFLASMGIYVFNRQLIRELLDNPLPDFGKHIIPHAIQDLRVFSYIFQGYWEDIGTIRSFFEANLDVVTELPRFNFFDMSAPIFSRPRFLPGSKINGAQIDHAVISDGCIINHARITHSIVGLRTVVGAGTDLNRVVILGSDYYESPGIRRWSTRRRASRASASAPTAKSRTPSLIRTRASANNVTISPAGKPDKVDHELLHPRRHRHHPQKRRHPARDGDLKGTVIT